VEHLFVTALHEPYHLFGLFSMTPTLWVFLGVQVALVLAGIVLCLLPLGSAIEAKRCVTGNTVALALSLVTSVLTAAAGYVESFAVESTEYSIRARQLALGMTTMMNAKLLGGVLAIALGALLMWQTARRGRYGSV
jgi:hypothetical protein